MAFRLAFSGKSTVVLLLGLALSGCSSYVVSGLHIEEVLGANKSAAEIRGSLGAPREEKFFRPAVRARTLSEWQAWPVVLFHAKADTLIVGWREYEYRGPIYNSGVAQAAGMVTGMTLGLGAPWAMSQVSEHQEREKTAVRRFKVWFTNDDRCVGYLQTFDSTADPNLAISVGYKNGRYVDLVTTYQAILRRRVVVEADVAKMTARFDFSFTSPSKEKALSLLREKLKNEAGIVIREHPDGTLHAGTTSGN